MTPELRIVAYLVAWMWLIAIIQDRTDIPLVMVIVWTSSAIGGVAGFIEKAFGRWWLLPKRGE